MMESGHLRAAQLGPVFSDDLPDLVEPACGFVLHPVTQRQRHGVTADVQHIATGRPACLRLRISAKHMSDSGLSNANMPINIPRCLS